MPDASPKARRLLGLLLGLVLGLGAGHAARGRFGRGLGWWMCGVGLYAVAVLGVILEKPAMMWLGVGAWALLRLVGAVDGFLIAARPSLPSAWPVIGFVVATVAGGQVEAYLSKGYLAEAFRLPSGSMSPTLLRGDHLFASKVGVPARGDVVVYSHEGKAFVKRLVGLPGDQIEIRGDVLVVDGRPVARRLLDDPCVDEQGARCETWEETLGGRSYRVHQAMGGERRSWPAVRLGSGMGYVLGDDRDNSLDSRFHGPIALSAIIGRATFIWWSSGPEGARMERVNRIIR